MTGQRAQPLPSSYWRQWLASVVSNLGDGINFVAVPLLALSLTGDERVLAMTVFATFVPWLILALPVGMVVDRVDRQLLMTGASLLRVGLFVTIAVGATTGSLSVWSLLVLLVVIGSCEVVFDSSAQAFLPMLVDPHDLARANGLLFAAEVVAGSIAGLSIGALLFDVSTGLPFSVNAMTFAVAAIVILSIRPTRVPAIDIDSPLEHGIASGWSWLRANRLLSTLAAMFAVTNLGLMFGQGIFVKYAIVTIGLSNGEYGLLLAITAMGAAAGGLVGSQAIDRLGMRTAIVVPYLVFGAAHLVIGLAPPAWVVGLAGFCLGACITIWNVVTVTIRQQEIPADRFGRVNAVYRWLGAAASALGVAAGGFVAHATNLQVPFLVGGAITLVAALVFGGPVLTELGRARQPSGAPTAPG